MDNIQEIQEATGLEFFDACAYQQWEEEQQRYEDAMNNTMPINTMSAEHVLGLNQYQAETVFYDVISQLAMQGEQEWDIEAQANRIMDNCKLYSEFFVELRDKK